MSKARQELKRLSRQSRMQLVQDLDRSGKTTGRVGLTYARHHPALLVGGGALLGTAVVAWMRRPKQPKVVFVQTAESPKPIKVKTPSTKSPWRTLLKSAVRMWIIDTMAAAYGGKDSADASDGAASEMEPVETA